MAAAAPAANTTLWTFTQLDGAQSMLQLADHAAPHGRPREKPVVEPEIEVREETTYYSGDNPPTRHLFGLSHSSVKLEGRFSDLYGGEGFARRKRAEVRDFVAAQRQVSVVWDDLFAAKGFIKKFKSMIESGGEIAWEMEVLIDVDDLLNPGRHDQQLQFKIEPADLTAQLREAMEAMDALQKVPTMRGSVFDFIGSLISAVNTATASVANVAAQIDSLATAPFQLLRRFRDGLLQLSTAVSNLRTTYDNLTIDIALESEASADAAQQFWDIQAAWAASSLQAMRLALEAARSSALAEQGQLLSLYTGREGDTWELISRRFYAGSSTRAADIRSANSIEAGANPVPGTVYFIPR